MQGLREAVYASLRGLRNERSSSFFKLNDVHAAEIRRIGFERVIEAGLLPEILQYLNFGELVRLATVSLFFRRTVSRMMSRKVHKGLQPFIRDTRSFLCMLDAHEGLMSGRFILDILLGRKIEEGKRQMTICVSDDKAAAAFVRHLLSVESYRHLGRHKLVDMSRAIYSEAVPRHRGIFDDKKQGILTCNKRIRSVQKGIGRYPIIIDIYNFEPDESLTIRQVQSLRAETKWLVQDTWSTCLINAMSLHHLTVYYPDYMLTRRTYELPNEVPCRAGRTLGSTRYHVEEKLKNCYDISHTQDTTWSYYEENNDHLPASLPLNLLGLLKHNHW